jgi:class 3 adenylate cyclase/tetratricopeptide (TPR) repeat protein
VPSAASVKKSNDSQIRVVETPANENIEGERKTVTALFADIKGSTEIEQDLDPEEARAIIDPALKIMIDAARHCDGYVQHTGDGIFALFGAPIAHEDHPQRALHAALRMQHEIRRYGDHLFQGGGVPIEIRVGINTGEVVMRPLKTGDSHIEYAPIGHTTNLASRMQAVARTGSVVVSEATRKLVEGYFQLKSIGPTRVKGVTEPVQVYEVTGLGPLRTRLQRAAARGYTKFVGRDHEMEALHSAAERAKTGHGQIVATSADAGIGKSRLFLEFKATSQSGWLVLDALSLSHDKDTAYVPLIDLLHVYFRITPGDDTRTRREKVAGKIAMLDRSLEQETLPHLFLLLGILDGEHPLAQIDPQTRRRYIQEAVKRILLRESLNQPLMLIFEDLHCMDGESEALLNLLADSMATSRVLLLVNYRPEYHHQWSSKTYYTQLRLDPLAKENADEMLSTLVGTDTNLVPLKRLVAEKAEGNPLFMEEIVLSLFEVGALVRNGEVRLAKPLTSLSIPPTVQAILASRIDRLPTADKELLQTLAVMGREFPLSLVRQVTKQSDETLYRMINDLQFGEFIYEQPTVEDIEYIFKHALTQEVAYKSVLADRREALHERTAAAIEWLYGDLLDDHFSELARHYRHSANTAKAVKYLDLAGQQAMQRSAYGEAKEYLTTGLELLKRMPQETDRDRRELGMQIALARSFSVTSGLGGADAGRALLRAHELTRAIDAPAELFTMLCGLVSHYALQLQLKASYNLGQELLALAENAKQPIGVAPVHGRLGLALMMMGDFRAAREHFEHVFAAMDQFGREFIDSFFEINFYPMWGTWALWGLGYSDQAREWCRRALSAAEKVSRPVMLANAHGATAMLYMLLLDEGTALEHADADIAIANEVQFPFDLAYARIVRGWALGVRGRLDEGITEMHDGMRSAELAGYARRARWYPYLAQLENTHKGPDQGLKVITEGLALLDNAEERFNEPELYRVQGELFLAQESSYCERAQSCFQQAILIARKQGAKSLELRATTSLARLLRDTNRRDEARAILAEIYNWFTEGFDTADMKEAKALLEELSA